MPFSRRSSRVPVKTDKHEIVWSNLAQDAGTVVSVILLKVVQSGAKDSTGEITIGSHVRGIYLEFQFSAETITNTKIMNWQIYVLRSPLAASAASNPNQFGQIDRKNIMKRGMEMLPKSVNTIIKRIVYVPLPRRRLGEGDQVLFEYIASSTETINSCGFAIYKELY